MSCVLLYFVNYSQPNANTTHCVCAAKTNTMTEVEQVLNEIDLEMEADGADADSEFAKKPTKRESIQYTDTEMSTIITEDGNIFSLSLRKENETLHKVANRLAFQLQTTQELCQRLDQAVKDTEDHYRAEVDELEQHIENLIGMVDHVQDRLTESDQFKLDLARSKLLEE